MELKMAKIAVPAIALAAVLLTITTMAALSASRNVDLSGTIVTVNVGVYSDAACSQPCSAIDVGALSPGNTFTQKIYVKNTGTVPVTLSMSTSNWNPVLASNYLTLNWNLQNYVLKPLFSNSYFK